MYTLIYNLVVFDLDGTLVDTIPDIADVFNKVLASEGLPGHPESDYRNFLGWGLKRTLELALPSAAGHEKFDSMLDSVIREYHRRPVLLSQVYPGIHELLGFLKNRGVARIVFTNKAELIARNVVDAFFAEGMFSTVIGQRDNYPPKPDPTAFFDYIESHKVKLSSILMVGDTEIDLDTAVNCGISFAGASWGFRSESLLERAGSTDNFPRPGDLHSWLASLKGVNYDERRNTK